jgi:7-cyano-7-deazaguanine synthase
MATVPVVGVLASAGLDSIVLVADAARANEVQPIYMAAGFAWEDLEQTRLHEILEHLPGRERIRPLRTLSVDMRDVHGAGHWAIDGTPPAWHTPDEDVYIVGRNVMLLAKSAVFCAHESIHRLLIGLLARNPFPDATPAFFEAMARALSLGTNHEIAIEAPYRTWRKADVIRLGAELGVPLALTLSCMNPEEGRHCGRCSKCRERHEAFRDAGMEDPTEYDVFPPSF